jgi:hypothetical protein
VVRYRGEEEEPHVGKRNGQEVDAAPDEEAAARVLLVLCMHAPPKRVNKTNKTESRERERERTWGLSLSQFWPNWMQGQHHEQMPGHSFEGLVEFVFVRSRKRKL